MLAQSDLFHYYGLNFFLPFSFPILPIATQITIIDFDVVVGGVVNKFSSSELPDKSAMVSQ